MSRPDPETIQNLEHLLSLARRGKIIAVAAAYLTSDGMPQHTATQSAVDPAIIGGLEMLKTRILLAAIQGSAK